MNIKRLLVVSLLLGILLLLPQAALASVADSWEFSYRVAPTCTEQGYDVYENFLMPGVTEKRNYVPALGHNYQEVFANITCEEGSAEYQCTRCGASYWKSVPGTGHRWNSGRVTREPTCTSTGVRVYTCLLCQGTKTETIPASSHSWDSGRVIKNATCNESGTRVYTCLRCGATRTEMIPSNGGHSWGSWRVEYPGTCVKQGMNVRKCTVCGKEDYAYSGYGDHSWGEWKTVKQPSAEGPGLEERVCQIDPSHKEQREIPFAKDGYYVLKGYQAQYGGVGQGNTYSTPSGYAYELKPATALHFLWADAQPKSEQCVSLRGPLYTDPDRKNLLTAAPVPGKTYYFSITILNSEPGDYSMDFSQVDPAQVDVAVSGFSVALAGMDLRFIEENEEYRLSLNFQASYDGTSDGTYVLLGFQAHYGGVRRGNTYHTPAGYAYELKEAVSRQFLWADAQPKPDQCGSYRGALFTDPDQENFLTDDPVPGKTYFFTVTLLNNEPGDYSLDFTQLDPTRVDVTVDGFTVSLFSYGVQFIEDNEENRLSLKFEATYTGASFDQAKYRLKGITGHIGPYMQLSEADVYWPGEMDATLIWEDAAPQGDNPSIWLSRFFTDPFHPLALSHAPQAGEAYYFHITVQNETDHDHSMDFTQVDNSRVHVTMDGFDVEYLRAEPGLSADQDIVVLHFKATYRGEAEPQEERAELTLTIRPRSGEQPYPDQTEFKPGEQYWFDGVVKNTGNVPVELYDCDKRTTAGWQREGSTCDGKRYLLQPGEEVKGWGGYSLLGVTGSFDPYKVSPGTETETLQGTLTYSAVVRGYRPGTDEVLCTAEASCAIGLLKEEGPKAEKKLYAMIGETFHFTGWFRTDDGLYWPDYNADPALQSILWSPGDGSPEYEYSVSRFYLNAAETSQLKTDPVIGETYYFHQTFHNIDTDEALGIDFTKIDPAQVHVTMKDFDVELLRIDAWEDKEFYTYWMDGAYLYFRATYNGGGKHTQDVPEPSLSVQVSAAEGAGQGKRRAGERVPFLLTATNTGNCPLYVPWWEDAGSPDISHSSAPNGRNVATGLTWNGYEGITVLNPGEAYTHQGEATVTADQAEAGVLPLKGYDVYWYDKEAGMHMVGGTVFSDVVNVPLTYPEEEEPEPNPALTLIFLYDTDQSEAPYADGQDTFDPEDSVYGRFLVINSGNVPLAVVAHVETEGVNEYDAGVEFLAPGESATAGWGWKPVENGVAPGSDTEALLGTVRLSCRYAGYDPAAFKDVANPGTELCRTPDLKRAWKVRRPGGPAPWPIPEDSAMQLTHDVLPGYESSDPAGYQLGESFKTILDVANIGSVDLDGYALYDPWDGYSESGAALAACTHTLMVWDNITVQTEDVERGYLFFPPVRLQWIDPDSGNERIAYSNPLVLPVISKTGLILTKGIAQLPENKQYFQAGESIQWTLTAANTGKEPIREVTITDQGVTIGVYDEIAPGEKLILSVPAHEVTEYEALVLGSVSNAAIAVGKDIQGVEHVYPSNPVTVPTNDHSPVIPPYTPDFTPEKGDSSDSSDPLPPGTPWTPTVPGTPGGGMDPLGPIHGLHIGASAYKASVPGPLNGEFYQVSETILFTITVKNIGNVPLENVEVCDSLYGNAPIGGVSLLPPGAEKTFPCSWTVTSDDVTQGQVVNQATVKYTFNGGIPGTPILSNPVRVPTGKTIPVITGRQTGTSDTDVPPPFKPVPSPTSDACSLALGGRGDYQLHYALHTCQEHAHLAQTADQLLAGGGAAGYQQAADAWLQEIDRLYDELFARAESAGKAAAANDRIAFRAYVDAYAALRGADAAQTQQAVCDMLRLHCAMLCCLARTAPAALPGGILEPASRLIGDSAQAGCGTSIDFARGSLDLFLDAEHARALAETLNLVQNASGGTRDKAFVLAQRYWQMALDSQVNIAYKAADRGNRLLIAAWRQALDQLITARQELLALLFPGAPEAAAEAAMNLYRDALIDACQHR